MPPIVGGSASPELSHASTEGSRIVASLALGSWDGFGGKASFLDLWEGSIIVLVIVAPPMVSSQVMVP